MTRIWAERSPIIEAQPNTMLRLSSIKGHRSNWREASKKESELDRGVSLPARPLGGNVSRPDSGIAQDG
jgi:hypothetical protein